MDTEFPEGQTWTVPLLIQDTPTNYYAQDSNIIVFNELQ